MYVYMCFFLFFSCQCLRLLGGGIRNGQFHGAHTRGQFLRLELPSTYARMDRYWVPDGCLFVVVRLLVVFHRSQDRNGLQGTPVGLHI